MTFEALTEIIVGALPNCDEAKVQPDARLIPDVCADSLDTVELAMALEDKTGVNVPDDLMATFRTVSDLHDYLNEHGA
ncbi:MAG: acyl carrier protein [Clostridia bacterium]|nr:acyl carrier protein [Clostridia bacterium]MBQ2948027.1 acyl carrier protein [Clostridia bacterium]MBQ4609121.1 acyl carrier protein [Clostridia bacterium]MBQ6858627.1 acyl carrier protein [Clostridia bacterium]MBQ7053390.1 acyl carrier protein [Clostridia bacterium]